LSEPDRGAIMPRGRRKNLIELNIPGREKIQLRHLVSDVNGTLAVDGRLIPGVSRALSRLSDRLEIHLLTADTHGRQEQIDAVLNLKAIRIPAGDEAKTKADYVAHLGPESVIAIGQGANDREMLRTAGIGVCILSEEGLSSATLNAADILVPDIHAALGLIEKPIRMVATLRE
jgi:soluble P-type ATPase